MLNIKNENTIIEGLFDIFKDFTVSFSINPSCGPGDIGTVSEPNSEISITNYDVKKINSEPFPII